MKLQIKVECQNLDKEAVFKLVELLEGRPSAEAEPVAEAEPAEQAPLAHEVEAEVNAQITLEDLAGATRPLLDEGKHEEVRALLTKYSVKSLPELKESQRIDFLRQLRKIGKEA